MPAHAHLLQYGGRHVHLLAGTIETARVQRNAERSERFRSAQCARIVDGNVVDDLQRPLDGVLCALR